MLKSLFSLRRQSRTARSILASNSLRLETLEERCMPSVTSNIDLSGSSLGAPSQAQFGQAIALQAQIRNTGTASSGAFQVQWFLSRDNVGSSDDILLHLTNGATSSSQSSITGNHSGSTFTVNLQLPGSVPAGF